MRALLLVLLMAGLALAAAPVAEAHDTYCAVGDNACWIKCEVSHAARGVLLEDHCHWFPDP